MNINFPLILVLAVFFTGAVALFDFFVLRRGRQARIAEVEKAYADRQDDERYPQARAKAAEESQLVEYSKSFFPVLAIVLVLRSFVAEPFQMPSESMVPTLEVGDFILVNKYTYGIRLPVIRTKVFDINDPERGDVMVFFPPNETRYFIKRVIGLPGDLLELRNNVLYINGEAAPQELISQEAPKFGEPCYKMRAEKVNLVEETLGDKAHSSRLCEIASQQTYLQPGRAYRVPEGNYFMMGDNRDNSGDSRSFGPVPEERIVGKAVAIWMHWTNKLKTLPSFERAQIIR